MCRALRDEGAEAGDHRGIESGVTSSYSVDGAADLFGLLFGDGPSRFA